MRSLICEWIASTLGAQLGLPIAPFKIANVSSELVGISLRSDISDLGIGRAFASQKAQVTELSTSHIEFVPVQSQLDVLAFDWWIHNNDRCLGEMGGNPNLFWDIEKQLLVVIDHNQAFDPHFSEQNFVDLHVFRDQIDLLLRDKALQGHYFEHFSQVMTEWQSICDTIPTEWWFADPEETVRTEFDVEATRQLLMRFQANEFWMPS